MHLEMNLDWIAHAHTSAQEPSAKTLILIQNAWQKQPNIDFWRSKKRSHHHGEQFDAGPQADGLKFLRA
jgi:hypothetical protein